MSHFQDLATRIDRLLLRYEELQRANELLQQQLQNTAQERDLLQTRLTVARNRIDTLLTQITAKNEQN